MKHNSLIIKKIFLLLVILNLMFAGTACKTIIKYIMQPTVIRSGFSEGLVAMLEHNYQISIPLEAKFISGYITNAQDSAIVINFEIEGEFTDESLKEVLFVNADAWDDRSDSHIFSNVEQYIEKFGIEYNSKFVYRDGPYTMMYYLITEDKAYLCLSGDRPSTYKDE